MTRKEITEALMDEKITVIYHATENAPECRSDIRINIAYWKEEWGVWSVGNLRCSAYLTRVQVESLIRDGKLEDERYHTSYILHNRRIRK